jgi:hypothetical protein
MSAIAAIMTNRSASPIGPLGSSKSIVLQPPRRVTAARDDKLKKTKYFFLFIYPPTSQPGLCRGLANSEVFASQFGLARVPLPPAKPPDGLSRGKRTAIRSSCRRKSHPFPFYKRSFPSLTLSTILPSPLVTTAVHPITLDITLFTPPYRMVAGKNIDLRVSKIGKKRRQHRSDYIKQHPGQSPYFPFRVRG